MRLQQVVSAPPDKKEELLKELEKFAFRGIPNVTSPRSIMNNNQEEEEKKVEIDDDKDQEEKVEQGQSEKVKREWNGMRVLTLTGSLAILTFL